MAVPWTGTCPADTWVVMAAFNEAATIGEVLDGLSAMGVRVVLVDDGSTDETRAVALWRPWVDVLHHTVNLGQGAAIQTGLHYALAQGARFLATMDGDGQHPANELPCLVGPLARGEADVVLGSRFLVSPDEDTGPRRIPFLRKGLLRAAARWTRLMMGLDVTDTHNGMRAFTAGAARRIHIERNRMAHASEILSLVAKERLRYVEVPVRVIYTPYSLAKGQTGWTVLDLLADSLTGMFLPQVRKRTRRMTERVRQEAIRTARSRTTTARRGDE